MMSSVFNPQFLLYLFGTDDMPMVYSGFFFAFLGALVSVVFRATPEAIDANPKSPEGFSWSYLIKDNWKKALSALIITLLCLRFMSLFIDPKYTVVGSAFIGYYNYRLWPMMLDGIKSIIPFFNFNKKA